jgi:hypothetical protein
MTTPSPRELRINAALGALSKAANEYSESKNIYEVSRVRYELAREQFAKTKELATSMLGDRERVQWETEHRNLRFVGTPLGEAITSTLRSHAIDIASNFDLNGKQKFNATLALDPISQRLEDGGYEFHSSTPQREINAALINLSGITKSKYGAFEIDDAYQWVDFFHRGDEESDKED